jgi:hypothetical protein
MSEAIWTREKNGSKMFERWWLGSPPHNGPSLQWQVFHYDNGDYTVHWGSSPIPIVRRPTLEAAKETCLALEAALEASGGRA